MEVLGNSLSRHQQQNLYLLSPLLLTLADTGYPPVQPAENLPEHAHGSIAGVRTPKVGLISVSGRGRVGVSSTGHCCQPSCCLNGGLVPQAQSSFAQSWEGDWARGTPQLRGGDSPEGVLSCPEPRAQPAAGESPSAQRMWIKSGRKQGPSQAPGTLIHSCAHS